MKKQTRCLALALLTALLCLIPALAAGDGAMPVEEMRFQIYGDQAELVSGSENRDYTHVTVPETYEGYPVREILDSALSGYPALETVTLPDSLKTIGSSVFAGDTALKSVTLPAGARLSGGGTFGGCTALEQVILPEGLEELGIRSFQNCGALKTVTIPERVKTIRFEAFAGSGIRELTLPAGLVQIDSRAFAGCKSLSALEIPAGVQVIDADAFADCDAELRVYPCCAAAMEYLQNNPEQPFVLYAFDDDDQAGDWTWAADSVYAAVLDGLVTGYPDNTFRPRQAVTRAEFVAMLYRIYYRQHLFEIFGSSWGLNPFPDARGQWYENPLRWACTMGLVQGDEQGLFHPDDTLTRQDMATMLYRFLDTFYVLEQPSGTRLGRFRDGGSVSAYARPAMEFCLENGLIQGMGEGVLTPKETATRSQSAAILERMLPGLPA